MIRCALLAGVALAGAAASAEADELADLKAEVAALDQRMAALAATPQVPQGFSLLSISEGALRETPGAPLGSRERAASAGRATLISVMPTAGAPAGATISWSGYSRAGVVYHGLQADTKDKAYALENGIWIRDSGKDVKGSKDASDWDVGARGQLLVQASTDTSVGAVGVEMKLRADFNGNGTSDLYDKVAWGYWSMTPELTFGGGYNQSLGDITYGYDGSCTCYFTDNADVDFNPGDTTQMRLSYAAGPVTFSAAVEDSSLDNGTVSDGKLGVAGEIAYAGDVFSGEIAGVWRDLDKAQTGAGELWQVGVGGSLTFGDTGSLTFAAATGQGPFEVDSQGTIINGLAYDNSWWGASVFSSVNLTSATHVELAGGYKHRQGDQPDYKGYRVDGLDYDTYAVLGGLYYSPVSQLTLGIEGEWYTATTTAEARKNDVKYNIDITSRDQWLDAVAVWSF